MDQRDVRAARRSKSDDLRKYEAPATAWMTLPGETPADPSLELYSPFGPLIAKTRLETALVDRINAYADTQLQPDQGREFLLPESVVLGGGAASLAKAVATLVGRYAVGIEGHRVERVELQVFWVVSQYAGTPSPVHFHSSDISGVLYLKLPEIDPREEEKTYISNRHAGYINFIIGGRERFSRSLISFKPRVGDFYIFPGSLLHGAEPFRGTGERRSMSFNAAVV